METPVVVAILSGSFLLLNTLVSKLLQGQAKTVDATAMLKNMKVSEKGRELRHKYGIDRLNCVFYHNGGTYFSGESQDKFTLRYEFVKEGLEKLQLTMAGAPASLLEDMPFKVKDDIILIDFNILEKVRQAKQNGVKLSPGYYGLLSDYNVDASVVKAIFKKIFAFKRLLEFKNPYSLEMVATIHIHWSSDSKMFLKDIASTAIKRGEFTKDLTDLADLLVEDRIQIDQFQRISTTKLHNL